MIDSSQTDARLQLRISRVRQLTPRIKAYELRTLDNSELPLAGAGSHLQIEYRPGEFRPYSICSNPLAREFYEIAVLCEPEGRGGSQFIHEQFAEGQLLGVPAAANHFPLHSDSSPAVLIAGGIGIAPIKAMAHTLLLRGRRFSLHYAGRSRNEIAFLAELEALFTRQLSVYAGDESRRLDMMALMAEAPSNTQFYCCGPQAMLADFETCANALGIAADRLHSERFAPAKFADDQPVVLELVRSNKIIQVRAEQPLLDALRAAGVAVNFDCCVGECGTCAVTVLEGEPDHRDHALSDAARANGKICLCVSRAKSETLVLDL